MKLHYIQIKNFRNYNETQINCGDGINVLLGENGEGKTNLLEAISYLCLTKSFFGANDATVQQIGKVDFTMAGELISEGSVRYHVRASYEKENGEKSFSINKSTVEKFSSVVGQFPIVVLSPESNAITLGMPVDRRKFMDFVISQSSKVYLEDLLEYRRILKQRNKILLDARILRTDCTEVLEPWNIELMNVGARLMVRRKVFAQEFEPIVVEVYHNLAGKTETPEMEYQPSVAMKQGRAEGAVREAFEAALTQRKEEERRMGTTIVGPHRDELDLRINGLELRKYASQGQHKSFLIALKVAEFFYLQRRCNERPMLLLDDVFSELDAHRAQRLLSVIEALGQTFITTTTEEVFPEDFDWTGRNKKFIVHQGTVVYDEAGNLVH